MMRPGAVIAALILFGADARADIVSERPDAVAVTIYHGLQVETSKIRDGNYYLGDAIGFITETRTLDLPAGPSTVQFRGVASSMVPQSAAIRGLPQGALEQNFDYDFLTPDTLVARSVGKTVRLVRTDPATGQETQEAATIRAASGGAILEIGGKLEALHCGDPPERLVFDEIPPGLTGTPTFSVHVLSPTAGRYTVKLSYIAAKMNWSADYVARVNPDGKTLDLTGWITLVNSTDTSFANAPTEVVAGHLNLTGDDWPSYREPQSVKPKCWPMDIDMTTHVMSDELRRRLEGRYPMIGVYASSPVTAVSNFDAHPLGEYKLYPLPQPTTVAARQIKQVQFLDRRAVKFERVYVAEISPDPDEKNDETWPAGVEYRMQNREETGLGKPLPGGTVSVMESGPDGAPVFAGEISVDDTPTGSTVYVDTGGALDVPWRSASSPPTRPAAAIPSMCATPLRSPSRTASPCRSSSSFSRTCAAPGRASFPKTVPMSWTGAPPCGAWTSPRANEWCCATTSNICRRRFRAILDCIESEESRHRRLYAGDP